MRKNIFPLLFFFEKKKKSLAGSSFENIEGFLLIICSPGPPILFRNVSQVLSWIPGIGSLDSLVRDFVSKNITGNCFLADCIELHHSVLVPICLYPNAEHQPIGEKRMMKLMAANQGKSWQTVLVREEKDSQLALGDLLLIFYIIMRGFTQIKVGMLLHLSTTVCLSSRNNIFIFHIQIKIFINKEKSKEIGKLFIYILYISLNRSFYNSSFPSCSIHLSFCSYTRKNNAHALFAIGAPIQ